MRLLLPFIFLAVIGCSKKDEKKQPSKPVVNPDGTTTVRAYFPNGKVKLEQSYKDTLRHGMSKAYDQDGDVTLELPYVNGKREGMSKRFYKGGVLAQTTEYKNDVFEGMQTKYRTNGDLMSEARYVNDFPCNGLKEYLENKKLKQKYPSIVVKAIDNTKKRGEYVLEFSMSENVRMVRFYLGELKGGCIHSGMYNVRVDDGRRVGIMRYDLPTGAFIMQELNIVAAVETTMGKTYITQKKYHLAAEN